jgi:hypothetical protein
VVYPASGHIYNQCTAGYKITPAYVIPNGYYNIPNGYNIRSLFYQQQFIQQEQGSPASTALQYAARVRLPTIPATTIFPEQDITG